MYEYLALKLIRALHIHLESNIILGDKVEDSPGQAPLVSILIFCTVLLW